MLRFYDYSEHVYLLVNGSNIRLKICVCVCVKMQQSSTSMLNNQLFFFFLNERQICVRYYLLLTFCLIAINGTLRFPREPKNPTPFLLSTSKESAIICSPSMLNKKKKNNIRLFFHYVINKYALLLVRKIC